MYTERYSRNLQSFHDVYLDYGSLIAGFLDTYPQLRDTAVLSTLADSISASSITLYDSNGRETVSSGQWIGLELGSDPDSSEDLEQMLKTELPKIGRTDRRILSGPTYNGITALGNGTMTLSVSADCNEEDFFYVRDKLNVSLQRIFREHEYSI